MIAEAANWFFATDQSIYCSTVYCKMVNLIKFRDAIIFYRVMDLYSCTGVNG